MVDDPGHDDPGYDDPLHWSAMTFVPPEEPTTSPGLPGVNAPLADTGAFQRFYAQGRTDSRRGLLYRVFVGWWRRRA